MLGGVVCYTLKTLLPTTQASGFAAGRNRAGYSDRLLVYLIAVLLSFTCCLSSSFDSATISHIHFTETLIHT